MLHILTLFIALALGVNDTSLENLPKDAEISFLLPIDWSKEPHRDLAVEIPSGWQSIQPASEWGTADLIEFIPQGEDGDNWSQIITLQKFLGKQIKAAEFTQLLKEEIKKKLEVTVITEESSTTPYQQGSFILKYNAEGKDEILGVKYLSGPYDCVGVQYTIRPSPSLTESAAIEKIKAFFSQNVSVTHP